MELLLTNARWLDPVTLDLRDTHILLEPGPDGAMITMDHLPPESEREGMQIVDCADKLVTRSFALGHHHLYSTLARGMPAPPAIPTNFPEILDLIWWRLDRRLDLPMIEASALTTAMLCAKRGVTFVVDHHASPFAVKGSLETIARAFEHVGVGHLLCYEMTNRDGEEVAQEGLDETERYLEKRVGQVGLHASFTVDDDLLNNAVALAAKFEAGLHIHVAEDVADQKHCMETYGKRVVQRLHDAGALESDQTLLGHCVHLDDEERKILRDSPVFIAQACESNQNNNVGLGRYDDLDDKVILGTDGMHVDMLRSLKAAYIAGQTVESIDFRGAYDRLRRTDKLVANTGAPGNGPNNVVILDYDSPTPITPDNAAGHFIFGLEAVNVHSVIAQGKLLVEDRRLRGVDEAAILAFSREQAGRLWRRLAE